MAVSLSIVAAKDGGGAVIVGGLQAQDKSGAGTGPFTLGHVLIDGLAGTNMAAVTAANAVKVDGSAVTQPVSLTSTTITGTVAATQSGTWNVGTVTTLPALVAGSALIGKVGIDQTTPGTTNKVSIGTDGTVALGAGSAAIGSVTISNANANGRAVPGSSAPVVLNSMTYKAVAASATATLFGTTGASGDYLDGVLIIPATAAAGAVTITDGSGSAITIFAGGGTTALPTLAPFFVPIGAVSSGGAGGWKVTTGTNVSVIGVGNFT